MGINKTCRAFKSLIQREGLEDEFEELDDTIIFFTNKMGIGEKSLRLQIRLNSDAGSGTG